MVKFDGLALKTLLPRPATFVRLVAVAAVLGWGAGCRELPEQGVARGEKLYHNCEACHGPTGLGRPEYGAPAIAGLGSWYVENQLNKFRQGHRGAHADDPEGLRMRPLSKSLLRGEADVKSVAEYVSQLEPLRKPEKTVDGGDPGRGADYFKTCTACHGADAGGMQALNAPSLLVTQDWYQFRQLQKFKSGIRGRAEGDITGSQMSAMVTALPDEQAIKDVVAYVHKLKK